MDSVIRGSMWWASIPHDACNPHSQSGMRPVVVVSNDKGNEHSPSLLVCPITTRKDRYHFIHPHIRCTSKNESYVLCEQVRVLDKELLGSYIGQVREVEQDFIDRALMTSMGLAPYLEKIDALEKEKSILEHTVEALQHSAEETCVTYDEDALKIGLHVKGIIELLGKSIDLGAAQSVSNSDVQFTAGTETNESQPSEPPKKERETMSAIDKFNARVKKCEEIKQTLHSRERKKLETVEVAKNLGRPNARKWDSQTIKRFVIDYTSLSEEELLRKYDLNSLTTAYKYYLRFRKNESL